MPKIVRTLILLWALIVIHRVKINSTCTFTQQRAKDFNMFVSKNVNKSRSDKSNYVTSIRHQKDSVIDHSPRNLGEAGRTDAAEDTTNLKPLQASSADAQLAQKELQARRNVIPHSGTACTKGQS